MPDKTVFPNLTGLIKQRHSCRTYQKKAVEAEAKGKLLDFMATHCNGLYNDKIEFGFIQKDPEANKEMKLAYGLLKNHNAYILAKTPNAKTARISYGYILEKIALKATELGVASCWVGIVDVRYFPELVLNADEMLPAILVVGYATEKRRLKEKLIRFAVKAQQRKPWDELFYLNDFSAKLTKEKAGSYCEALEMLRLAPSAGNSQPWRIVFDESRNAFHFYKEPKSPAYEERGMHDVDMGICMSHFELTARNNGLTGSWKAIDAHALPKNNAAQYVLSWVIG